MAIRDPYVRRKLDSIEFQLAELKGIVMSDDATLAGEVSDLQSKYDSYIAALQKAFADVVTALQNPANVLTPQTDAAIAAAQADVAGLTPVVDPTVPAAGS